MNGKLYALSTGLGAPDLITVRAALVLGSLDILYAPAGRKGAIVWRCRLCATISASRRKYVVAISL